MVRHNLEGSAPSRVPRMAGAALKGALEAAGGYGGDFATVLSSLRRLNRADVVFSTVDTVGIPLMLLARARLARSPFVYTAIGLPERLVRLRSARMERLYARGASARRRRSWPTASTRPSVLTRWLGERGAPVPVEFVPFGVDVRGVPPDELAARRRRRLDRGGPASRLRAASGCRADAARDELPRRDDERSRALARRPAEQRLGRERPAVRRDAPAARARTRRRAARARQQLLGRDDGAPPGDGARQARRRHAYGCDRDGLRARGRGERATRRARGRRRLRQRARGAAPRRRAGACARLAGTRDRRVRAHVGPLRRAARGALVRGAAAR